MKRLFWILALCLLGGLLAWGVQQGQQEIRADAEADQPVQAPLRAKDGVVTLDARTLKASGLQTSMIGNGQMPPAAIVWWQGKPYIYVQKDSGAFERTPYHANEKTSFTQPVVTVGAQLLLSEELRGGIQIGD